MNSRYDEKPGSYLKTPPMHTTRCHLCDETSLPEQRGIFMSTRLFQERK